jgi:Fic family protein
MKYTSFLKLFRANMINEYEARYKNAKLDNCYHELDINIGKNKAIFFATPEIYEKIIEIEKISEKLLIWAASNPLFGQMQSYIMNGFIIDEIKSTNNIEGVRSSRADINNVITGAKSNKRLGGMVNRYLLLYKTDKPVIASSKDIRKIYDELVAEEIRLTDPGDAPDGEIFRTKDVAVVGGDGKILHHGILPEAEIIKTMDKALEFSRNAKVHYLIKIAVFHFLFGYIHPFYDGNGRMNRFISSYFLSFKTFSLIGYRLSFIINKNLSAYYKAFETVDNPLNLGDITPFIITFTDLVLKAAKNTENIIVGGIEKYKKIHSKIYKLPSASEKTNGLYALLIAVTLFSENGISKEEITKNLGISTATFSRRIEQIPPTLLKTTKIGNNKLFSLDYDELMRIIGG